MFNGSSRNKKALISLLGLVFVIAFIVFKFTPVHKVRPQGASAIQSAYPTYSVSLTKIPSGSTTQQIQDILAAHHNVYFEPGSYNIGTININGWTSGTIMGAGRLTTTLNGQISISGSTGVTIANMSITDSTTTSGHAAIDVTGSSSSNIVLMSLLVSAGSTGTAIHAEAPGQVLIQGVHTGGNQTGVLVDNANVSVHIFGGNYQGNDVHIHQIAGHLDARAFGVQGANNGKDIEIDSPSPSGYHVVEGVRSEDSSATTTLVYVPSTSQAVNVVVRGNTMSGLRHYADYNGSGTLVLMANSNAGGDSTSNVVGISDHSPAASTIESFGNKYGSVIDTVAPFDLGSNATMVSTGDMWWANNQGDYSSPWTYVISSDSMTNAGKSVPSNLTFTAENSGVNNFTPPTIPAETTAEFPTITDLSSLMLNVEDYGAIPNDGNDDSAAIQSALDASLTNGVAAPIYFPAGVYNLSQPIFLDHFGGGGFFGDGNGQSILRSTSGAGVVNTDGAGYGTYIDMGFENTSNATSRNFNMGWVNNSSSDQVHHPNTGAALQANMFYRDRFEYGSIGLAAGDSMMGSEFLVMDSIFSHLHASDGTGGGFSTLGYNALTDTLANSTFDDVDHAVYDKFGSFNMYNDQLTNVSVSGIHFYSISSDGVVLAHNTMDSSPVTFISTNNSSSGLHVLDDSNTLASPSSAAGATNYYMGGSIVLLNAVAPGRVFYNGGGIGGSSVIADCTLQSSVSTSGFGHAFYYNGGSGCNVYTANAGSDQTITLPTSSVTLSGSGTDTLGTISSYAWDQTAGATAVITSPTSASTSVTGLAAGSYTFRLTITDSRSQTATDTVQVTVQSQAPSNVAPVANAGSDQTITLPTSTATLSGSGTDSDGTIASYAWTKVSGPSGGAISSASSASTGVTGLTEGTYVYRLTVTDNQGATGVDTMTLIVNPTPSPSNVAPVANAGSDQTITLPTASITLSGSGTDSDGTIASYAWTKISGPNGPTITSSTAASTTVTGLNEGSYVFQLQVTDNQGATGTDTMNLTVNPAPVVLSNNVSSGGGGGGISGGGGIAPAIITQKTTGASLPTVTQPQAPKNIAPVVAVTSKSTVAQIANLQSALNAVLGNKLKTKLVVDGHKGAGTIAAIRLFQKLHGIKPDGSIGPKTAAVLNQIIKGK